MYVSFYSSQAYYMYHLGTEICYASSTAHKVVCGGYFNKWGPLSQLLWARPVCLALFAGILGAKKNNLERNGFVLVWFIYYNEKCYDIVMEYCLLVKNVKKKPWYICRI